MTRSTQLGSNNIRTAYATETHQQTTVMDQIQVHNLTFIVCAYQCLMNADCIAISFDRGDCQFALN